MTMRWIHTAMLMVVLGFLPPPTESFVVHVSRACPPTRVSPTIAVTSYSFSRRSVVRSEKKEVTYDGADRGRYLFALVFFICIWQFSIPPSFRRAKFCPPACVKERSLCRTSTCVTFGEWTSDIAQYYRDGGGIQWDFSIDPNTLAENERFIQSLLGNKKP